MADGSAAPTLTIGADVRALEAQMTRALKSTEKSMDAMEARATRAEKKLTDIFGKSKFGEAFGKTAGALRNDLLAGAQGQVGAFGASLEALGPAGMAGAAGVIALGAAVKSSLDTAKWSADMLTLSKSTRLTTDQIQAFDHVFTTLGIDSRQGMDSLSGLSKTIGLVESGFSRAQSVKVFTDALHITPEQLRGWGDLEHQLPHVLEAMSKLNGQELQGLSTRLKVDPGVIATLVDARDKLADLENQAKKYGLTVDHQVIAKSAAAEAKLKEASEIIDKNLKVAFADLVQPIADATTALAKFLSLLTQVPTEWNTGMEKYALISIMQGPGAAVGQAMMDRAKRFAPPVVTSEDIKRELGKPGTFQDATVKGRRGARGPTDRTDQLTKTASEDLDRADRALADAQKSLTENYQARADFEVAANDAAAKVEQDKLKADLDALLKDKTIDGKQSDILQAKIEQASAEVEQARVAKNTLALRQAAFQTEDRQIEVYRTLTEAQIAALRFQASIAPEGSRRTDLSRQALLLQQQLDRDTTGTTLDRQLKNHEITQAQRDEQYGALLGLQSVQTQQFNYDNAGPLAKFARDSSVDIGNELQVQAVTAMKTLNEGLAEAIVNGKNLKEILSNSLKKLGVDLLNKGLSAGEGALLGGGGSGGSSPLGFFGGLLKIFGFAGGGEIPGSGRGDHVPILAEPGERIIRNGPSQHYAPFLDAINSGRPIPGFVTGGVVGGIPSRFGGAPTRISVHSTYDMRGTSGDEAINARIAASEQRTSARVMDAVQRSAPGWAAQDRSENG